jgi:Fe-S cluster biogenesis protein NfuA
MIPFSDEDLYIAVSNFLPKIEEYVKSHEGTMKLLGIKDGTVYIELGGTCNGCSMSTMTTKMVVQKKLRELIHPEISVESIFPGQEDMLPSDIYKG